MGNLWHHKNHHYKSKYYIVLLQNRSEIIQFNSGHPVKKIATLFRNIILGISSENFYKNNAPLIKNDPIKLVDDEVQLHLFE